jgi:myo-inositol-1(or 4)-monophosphatase
MLEYSEARQISDSERVEYLEFALGLAAAAGSAILPFFRAGAGVENKLTDGGFDPVTEADHAAEEVIREQIRSRYPEHGIFGEEFGSDAGNGLTWVIDPIDGTRAFMSGLLHWGVLLGLFNGERPVLGVMHQPFTGEFFAGDCQHAHYHRGEVSQPLQVRQCGGVAQAVLGTTSPKLFTTPFERRGLEALEEKVRLSRYGGDCYLYAMLAMGQLDIVMDAGLQPYDVQALVPIIEGAGGVVTTAQGGDASMGGFVVATGSAELHAEVLATIRAGSDLGSGTPG